MVNKVLSLCDCCLTLLYGSLHKEPVTPTFEANCGNCLSPFSAPLSLQFPVTSIYFLGNSTILGDQNPSDPLIKFTSTKPQLLTPYPPPKFLTSWYFFTSEILTPAPHSLNTAVYPSKSFIPYFPYLFNFTGMSSLFTSFNCPNFPFTHANIFIYVFISFPQRMWYPFSPCLRLARSLNPECRLLMPPFRTFYYSSLFDDLVSLSPLCWLLPIS